MLVQRDSERDARKPTAEMTNFSDEEIGRQLQLGEDSAWEFKRIEFSGDRPRSPRPDDLADEIAAFANSDGGVLLCGVTDRGDVEGMSRAQMDRLVRVLEDIPTNKIKPPLSVTIRRRVLHDTKPFVLVAVPKREAQHDSPPAAAIAVSAAESGRWPAMSACVWPSDGGRPGFSGSISNRLLIPAFVRWMKGSGSRC